MAKVWVLDTETKGTGAEMVPLDKVIERRRSALRPERSAAIRRRRRAQQRETTGAGQLSEPRPPRTYKLVNALSGQTVAEGVGAREIVELLVGMRSVVDARIYSREPEAGEWRPLTLREQKRLWAHRPAPRPRRIDRTITSGSPPA
jgi:hypothetical protein